jgi:DNA-binding CsgD family transcriptional regulator
MATNQTANPLIESASTTPVNYTSTAQPVSYIINYTGNRYSFIHPWWQALLGYDGDILTFAGRGNFWNANDLRVFNQTIFPEELLFLQSCSPADYCNYSFSFNYRGRSKNGDQLTLLERFNYLCPADHDGDLIAVCSITDITNYKEDTRIIHTIEKVRDCKTSISPIPLFKSIYYPDIFTEVLSKREIEILNSIYQGLSSKEIADRLSISLNTINNHRKNMLYKTKTGNCAELIRYAIKNRLLY